MKTREIRVGQGKEIQVVQEMILSRVEEIGRGKYHWRMIMLVKMLILLL